MVYRQNIASVIQAKVKNGETDFSLHEFDNQQDVADTANVLASKLNLIETVVYMNDKAWSFHWCHF